ncbi:hypothetical protein MHBO_000872, partial [Bonamia ostreae]
MTPKSEFVKEDKTFNFDVKPSPEVVALDVEIIKLTAQFVAANGRSFLATVSNREQKNPQFAFLKPTNASLFLYFSDLVQAYQRILNPSKETLSELKSESKDEKLVFDKLLGLAEFIQRTRKHEDLNRKNKEDEKREMALIDWHSFIILETIDYKDGDDDFLPPPSMTIDEINEHLEAEKRLNENIDKVGAKIIDEGLSDKNTTDKNRTEEDSVALETVPSMRTNFTKTANPPAPISRKQSSVEVQRCVVCNKNIPVSEIEEHIRIELLDPKWREQRLIAQSKKRKSTLAGPGEMSRNLKEFVGVRKRPFARPEERVNEDVIWNGNAKSAETSKIGPDKFGVKASVVEQNRNDESLIDVARENVQRQTIDNNFANQMAMAS